MIKIKPIYALAALLLGGCAASNFPARAQTTRVEAETKLASGDLKILDLPDASGGKAVSIARDWQPLLIAPLPATGDEFTVWVRYKDKPVLVKADLDGGQKDLGWIWDAPAELTWKRAGRFKREEIGKNLIVIRGGEGGQGPVLDCVVFATDDAYNPDADTKTDAPAATGKDKTDDKANMGENSQVALGLKDAPDGQLYQAEDYAAANVIEAAGASGGKAVVSDNDWQPLVSIPLPKTGDAWKVWVRRKGGPFTVKTKAGDRWNWNKPDKFEWQETDVFSRDELGGENLVIGRNDGGKQPDSVQIDAIVLQPAVKRDLPADKPDAAKPAQKVAASIDWSQTAGPISPLLWGINESEIYDAPKADDTKFQTLLGDLDAPLIRLHRAGSSDAWTSAQTRDWDVAKIKAGFQSSTGLGGARLMVNIANWPSWLSKSEVLEADKVPEFAALCAKLVKVMRDEVKRPVAYWEITNELDGKYEKAGKLDDLWKLYNAVAAAMRREDPNAKLGGPALTWAKAEWVEGFLKNCPDVQFVSWHNYGTGDLYETNADVYGKVETNIGAIARGALELVRKYDNGRKLQTFLTETNVKYTWDPYERRHQNAVGSVFHALVVKQMAQDGVTGVNLWAQKGQAYGSLVNGDDTTRPSYQLYQWGPQYLSGQMVKATSGDDKSLEILPVISKNGRAVLLLNKTDHALKVPAASKLLPGVKVAQSIDTNGFKSNVEIGAGELNLPGYSLTLLRD